MTTFRRRLMLALGFTTFALFAQDGWTRYSSPEYGFSMLIPQGMKMEEKEWSGGWAGAHGAHDGVEFIGIAKMGKEPEKEIIRFGIEVTGIAEKHWTMVDQGKGYKVYRVEDGDDVLFASVAIGAKASFLLFLKTTKSDMNQHKADYQTWYESVRFN